MIPNWIGQCGEKLHAVRRKWEIRRQREQEEIERRQKEAIPADGWPTPKKIEKPADVPNV
jgi:hypothetical protein